jgi:hypothetical protein
LLIQLFGSEFFVLGHGPGPPARWAQLTPIH